MASSYSVSQHENALALITLGMLPLAILAVTGAALKTEPVPPAGTGQLGAISANEIRRLFAVLTRPPIDEDRILIPGRRIAQ
ncbi:hypothetical protein [Nonomuraea sp. NPDC048916]|uniref:hypothetical protein n=1 Tax=Nonomuraea sp. NPDC048916 TaxID=3154232 RepID=UPI00340CB005